MKKQLLSVISIISVAFFMLAGTAMAQDANEATDAPAADAPATPEKPVEVSRTLGYYWTTGGITMYPLALLAIFGSSLIIYNAIAIRKKKFLNPVIIQNLEVLINDLKIQEAIDYCEKHPSPLSNIVGVGLSRVDERDIDIESISAAMEEASTEEFAPPYVFINYLAFVASISPMVGLLGTVTGMIKAFGTIASEGAGSASRLADNISECLITTAVGMIVGIPAMFFFFVYKNKFGSIISGSSRIIGDLMFTLKTSAKYGPQSVEDVIHENEDVAEK